MSIMRAPFPTDPPSIRPFDIQRDMKPVADLIEICFAERLNRDGKALIRKLRSSAGDSRFHQWARRMAGQVSLPLSGYVWVEGGNVIGNVSLVPFRSPFQNKILIANVAVHPDYQRQGIARRLMEHTLQHLAHHTPDQIWLQVEEDNQAAVQLYLKTGFEERIRRASWVREIKARLVETPAAAGNELTVIPRPVRHWRQQKTWLKAAYPEEIRWHFPLKMRFLRGGIWGTFLQIMEEGPHLKQWSAVHESRGLLGVLTWQASSSFADRIWLAAPPGNEQSALRAFFPLLTQQERFHKPLRLNFPPGRAHKSLERAGFQHTRTLIWMRWTGSFSRPPSHIPCPPPTYIV